MTVRGKKPGTKQGASHRKKKARKFQEPVLTCCEGERVEHGGRIYHVAQVFPGGREDRTRVDKKTGKDYLSKGIGLRL